VLSAKAASGAACCDDVPGVGTYDLKFDLVKKSILGPNFRPPAIQHPQEAFAPIYNPSYSLVERSIVTPKFYAMRVCSERKQNECAMGKGK